MDGTIINQCMSYALNKSTTGKFLIDDIYKIDNLLVHDEIIIQNLNIIKKIDKLFSVNDSEIEVKVQIGVCKSNKKCDYSCGLLHICEHEIKRNGCRRFCRFDHTLETPHNINVLQIGDLNNIDFNLIKRYLQKFYKKIGIEDKSENLSSYSKNEKKLIVVVDVPKEFKYDSNELFLLFSNEKRAGGGPIFEEKSFYDKDNFKAYIFYESQSVAERVANKKTIIFQTLTFIVTLKQLCVNEYMNTPSNEPSIGRNNKENINNKEVKSNSLKVSDLTGNNILTFDKIRSRFIFAVNNIVGVDIDKESNTAIVKFDSFEVAESMSHLKFDDLNVEMVNQSGSSSCSSQLLSKSSNQKNNMNKREQNLLPLPNDIIKSFKNNLFLNILLDNQDPKWKIKLFNDIYNDYGECILNNNNLIIKCKLNKNLKNYKNLVTNWENRINSIITSFINDFSLDSISLDDYDLNLLKDEVNRFNQENGFSIGYKRINKNFHFVAKRQQVTEFLNRIQDNVNKKSKNLDYFVPKLEDEQFYSLINPLIEYLKPKFPEIENIQYESTTQKIQFRGPSNKVDEILMIFSNCIPKIRCEKLRFIDQDSLQCSNLINFLENIILEKNLLSKLKKTHEKLFLIYFVESPQIDSPSQKTYEDLDKYLSAYYTCSKIDCTKYCDILDTVKWTEFKVNNLISNQNLIFDFVEKNSTKELIIFGRKEIIFDLEIKLQNFLVQNKSITKKFFTEFNQNEILLFKFVLNDVLKKIESQYVEKKLIFDFISIDNEKNLNNISRFHEYEFVLNNCPENILSYVKSVLKIKSNLLRVTEFEISGLPGLEKTIHKTNVSFRHDLEKIQNDTETYISYQGSFYDYKYEEKVVSKTNNNLIHTQLEIGKSVIKIVKGNIVTSKADVIINSCPKSLRLNEGGILSKFIAETAGNQVQNELIMKYPNGILTNNVAVSSAGNMINCKKLYHITCPHYDKANSAACNEILQKIIENCLNQLKKDDLKTIAIPAIGSGNLNFPSNIVTDTIIDTCLKFMYNNTNEKYEINLIIYEKDLHIYESFIKKMKDLNENKTWSEIMKPSNKIFKDTGIKRAKAIFQIISDDELKLENVSLKIKELINKYIIKEIIKNDAIKNLKEEKLKELLNVTSDIELFRKEDGEISIYGYKDDVVQYKEKLNILIINHIEEANATFKNIIKKTTHSINKNIQWEYYDNDEWKQFSLYLNTVIEEGFENKKPKVVFMDENGEESIIDFKNLTYSTDHNHFNIKRTEKSNSDFKLPNTWTITNQTSEYDLIKLDRNSNEYYEVHNDFITKMQKSVSIIEIERIQNKRLYQSYLIHKEYIKKKNNNNENEKILYHGTDEKNIESICATGFNRSYCGTNGVAYGQGVYFALNSSYSHNYTKGSTSTRFGSGLFMNHQHDCRKMFRCRVLVGSCTQGNSSMKVAPKMSNGSQFDSTGDPSSTIFVVYHDNQCYPEYLITYT